MFKTYTIPDLNHYYSTIEWGEGVQKHLEFQRKEYEDRIIGQLFRDLNNLKFEAITNKTYNYIRYIVHNAKHQCEVKGYNPDFIDGFIKSLSMGTYDGKDILQEALKYDEVK